MSDWDEKLANPEVTAGVFAMCKLKHLKTRWGVVVENDWRVAPEMIIVNVMEDHREYWKRWRPTGVEPKKMNDEEYQLVERVKR